VEVTKIVHLHKGTANHHKKLLVVAFAEALVIDVPIWTELDLKGRALIALKYVS
jgi:hypothetical protein